MRISIVIAAFGNQWIYSQWLDRSRDLTSHWLVKKELGAEKGFTKMKMSHTRLLVTNYKDCFIFYRDILGFPVLWGDENSTYADFDVDGHKLALFMREPMAEAIGTEKPQAKVKEQDYICLVFAVEDVDSAYQSLKETGVKLINEPHDRKDWGIRCFHMRDPDGNLIEFNRDFGVNGE